MANFYRKFLQHAAEGISLLDSAATTKKKRDRTPVNWTPELAIAFEATKKAISDATLLAHTSNNAEIVLHVDASEICIGAALHQVIYERLQPLGFFSKRLSETKQRYSTYDRELEAIFQSIRHFSDEIEGRQLVVYTDHKPLTYAMTKSHKTTNQRQARQLDYINQFTTNIRHITGEDNDGRQSTPRSSRKLSETTSNFSDSWDRTSTL